MTQLLDKTRFIYYPPRGKAHRPGNQGPNTDRLIKDLTIHGENADYGLGAPHQVKELVIKSRKFDPPVMLALPERTYDIEFNVNPAPPARTSSSSSSRSSLSRPSSAQPRAPGSTVSFAPQLGSTATSPLTNTLSASFSSSSALPSGRPHSARTRVAPPVSHCHTSPRTPSSQHKSAAALTASFADNSNDAPPKQALFGESVHWRLEPRLIARDERVGLVLAAGAQHATRRRFNDIQGARIASVRENFAPRGGGMSPEQHALVSAASMQQPLQQQPLAPQQQPLKSSLKSSALPRPAHATSGAAPLAPFSSSSIPSTNPASMSRPQTAAPQRSAIPPRTEPKNAPISFSPVSFHSASAASFAALSADSLSSSQSTVPHPALPRDFVYAPAAVSAARPLSATIPRSRYRKTG
jgi:hypothetical protein